MTTKRIKDSFRILAVFMGLAFLGSQATQAGPGEGTHKGAAKRHEQDVNGDQLTDLVFHFRLNGTDFSCGDIPSGDKNVIVTGTVTGLLTDGETEFVGTDDFEIRK
jgi:hypothetical protein